MEYVARHLPEGMAIIAKIQGVLEPVMWLMGYETFALAIYDQPDLIKAMFRQDCRDLRATGPHVSADGSRHSPVDE